MYTEYLKAKLTGIAALEVELASIRARYATASQGHPCYPSMCGALEASVRQGAILASSALRWTVDHVEPAEREGARLAGILESIGIDLDEPTLAALELIGKRTYDDRSHRETSPYRDERNAIYNAISKSVADVQESEREVERENAELAIIATGFVRHEDDDFDGWVREQDAVTIEMTYKNRATNYTWELCRNHGSSRCVISDSGKSGEFFRLLALIAPKESGSACGGSPSGEPCDTETLALKKRGGAR